MGKKETLLVLSISKQTEVISMGKKNIQPNSSQPVFRSLVARPALEELREENLTEGEGQANEWGMEASGLPPIFMFVCSYDGDDE